MYKKSVVQLAFAAFLFTICLQGCLFPWIQETEKSYQEQALDQIRYLATDQQCEELRDLYSTDRIDVFLDSFWNKLDPTPDTPENELREIMLQRYDYANAHFREMGMDGCNTDRGRIFMIFGPPEEIAREPLLNLNNDLSREAVGPFYSAANNGSVKSMEIWTYNNVQGSHTRPSAIFSVEAGPGLVFVFVDSEGWGHYEQVYSSSLDEINDPRLMHWFR